MTTSAIDDLLRWLRPAGGGLHLVSTGLADRLELQKRVYGARDEAGVEAAFQAQLGRLGDAKCAILAIPSDVGAGFRRGANLGPMGIRERLLAMGAWPGGLDSRQAVDVGDVFVVPQLLEDDMLSDAQLARTQRALYPSLSDEEARRQPVSPLSIASAVLDRLFELNPDLKIFAIGGDHSVAWPVARALVNRHGPRLGIVQFDAHTDLLQERLGIKICFATWSWHAAKLLAAPTQMVQVGIRASRHDRAHWEGEVGVVQFWADTCRDAPDATIDAIVRGLEAQGVGKLYISNDIDGTDETHAPATGTPEPAGLDPDWVCALIERLGAKFDIVAGDIVEVAPPLGPTPDDASRTLDVAGRYVDATLRAMLD